MGDADLVLLVLDGSSKVGPDDCDLLERTSRAERIVVMNKCDLASFEPLSHCVSEGQVINVSAWTGAGLAALHDAIVAKLNSAGNESGSLLITNARHYDLLCNAQRELETARKTFRDQHSEELVLAPLHNSLKLLGQITGETTTEDILSEIFATFCIGK
jgi:tRNA modification GTPase